MGIPNLVDDSAEVRGNALPYDSSNLLSFTGRTRIENHATCILGPRATAPIREAVVGPAAWPPYRRGGVAAVAIHAAAQWRLSGAPMIIAATS